MFIEHFNNVKSMIRKQCKLTREDEGKTTSCVKRERCWSRRNAKVIREHQKKKLERANGDDATAGQ